MRYDVRRGLSAGIGEMLLDKRGFVCERRVMGDKPG